MGSFAVVVVKLLGFCCGSLVCLKFWGWNFGVVEFSGMGLVLVVVVKLLGFRCGSLDAIEFLGWIIYLLLYKRDYCCGKASSF